MVAATFTGALVTGSADLVAVVLVDLAAVVLTTVGADFTFGVDLTGVLVGSLVANLVGDLSGVFTFVLAMGSMERI